MIWYHMIDRKIWKAHLEITLSDDEMEEMEEMDWTKERGKMTKMDWLESALHWTRPKKGRGVSITKSTLYWVHSRKFVDINYNSGTMRNPSLPPNPANWVRRSNQLFQLNKDGGRKMGGLNACHYQKQHQQQYWHWRNLRKEECIWKKRVKSHKEEYKETIFQHNRRHWYHCIWNGNEGILLD